MSKIGKAIILVMLVMYLRGESTWNSWMYRASVPYINNCGVLTWLREKT